MINGSWEYDAVTKKITLQVEQAQMGDMLFNLPLEIGYYKAGSTTPTIIKMHLTKKQQVQSFTVAGRPDKLEIDPRNILLSKNSLSKK